MVLWLVAEAENEEGGWGVIYLEKYFSTKSTTKFNIKINIVF